MHRVPPIALDFARPASLAGRLAPLLLLAGAIALLIAGLHHRSVSAGLRAQEGRVAQMRELVRRTLPALDTAPSASPETREQVRKANEVLARINVPWSELFGAIETAQEKDIALLAVQPDAQARSVTIVGQAQDMKDVLAYMRRLETGGRLREVLLTGHEIKVREATQPIEFTLGARWVEGR